MLMVWRHGIQETRKLWSRVLVPFHPRVYIGLEVSRYFYGGFCQGDKCGHAHDQQAFSKMKDYIVGRLANPYFEQFFVHNDEPSPTNSDFWTLNSRIALTPSYSVLKFYRADLKIPIIISSPDIYGKYITVTLSY